jgi:hypothetical protein
MIKGKGHRRIQIALSALRKLASVSGYVGAEARIALKKCREVKEQGPRLESVTCYALLSDSGRFIVASWDNAPCRVKCTVTWEVK